MKAEGAKATASDGATEIHTLVGVGLVVSAFAFNRVVAERDALKEEWRLWQDQRVRLEKAAAELERIKALEALENGARVRNAEGGTKYQPPIEEAAIDAIRNHLGVKND